MNSQMNPGPGSTILLVENDREFRQLFSWALVLSGYVVLECDNFAQAIEILRRHREIINYIVDGSKRDFEMLLYPHIIEGIRDKVDASPTLTNSRKRLLRRIHYELPSEE